uniref:hypothetical protein n=1 Tax=Flavobacterium sp. TaxID=239 RepID=UPI00404ACF58
MLEIKLNSETSLEKGKLETISKVYFEKFGFKIAETKENLLKFRKGSELRNSIAFNPLNWKSDIQININQKNEKLTLDCIFSINTIHQLVTDKEIEIWNEFVNGYKMLITNELFDHNKIINEAKQTKKSNIKILLLMMLLGIISLTLSTFILTKTGIGIIMITPPIVMIASFIYLSKYYK